MASLFYTGNLVKLMLLISGTAILLMGFYGALMDFIHDWKIEELGSIFAVLSGAAILLATILVYVVIPEYQSHQRIERLSHYYMGKPEGEAKGIKHNIMERSQAIMGNIDILADNVRECVSADLTSEACIEKISLAREIVEQIKSESDKLCDNLKQLEDYVKTKKHNTTTLK